MFLTTLYRWRFQTLAVMYLSMIIFAWPGHMVPDSMGQYAQALTGSYNDHHPPLMSFVWSALNRLYPHYGTMYVLQTSFLYLGLFILLKTSDLMQPKQNRPLFALLLLLLPIYPQVLIYSFNIVKDTQFALSFLLGVAILAYYTIRQERPSFTVTILILLIFIYGAAVKYQGLFCVLIPALWLGALLFKDAKWGVKMLAGLTCYALIYGSITTITNVLVPEKSKNNSWQLVKFYDLAAISVGADQDLIPTDNKNANYSFAELKRLFKYPSVDPYVFGKEAVLKVNPDPKAVSLLYRSWFKAIAQHPWLYLKHRAINISNALLSRPGLQYVLPWIEKLPHDNAWYPIVYSINGALFFLFMSHLPVILLGFGYFWLAIYSWGRTVAAPVLLGMSSLALTMVGILFFMSMAGTPRYTYISIVIIHASHIFAYTCFKRK